MPQSPYKAINSDQNPIYLDTSFINRYAKDYSWSDARSTKGFHAFKNNFFVISPVNIFELLQIKNEIERETLIVICQNLFYERCLPSPEELILRHIKSNCPTSESGFELISQCGMALAWEDIVLNTRKTFIYDAEDLRTRKTLLYNFFKSMRNFIHKNRAPRFFSSIGRKTFHENDIDAILSKLNINLFNMTRESAFITVFITAIVCGGLGIDPQPFSRYWSELQINDLTDRLHFLREQYPGCFTHGPAASIGMMASLQASKSPNAGAMFDCLHSVYLAYSKSFLVRDEGFLRFRETLHPILAARIRHFDELQIVTHKRGVYTGSDQIFL